MSAGVLVFIVLLVLHLTGAAHLSWLVVFLPLIAEAAIDLALLLFFGGAALLAISKGSKL